MFQLIVPPSVLFDGEFDNNHSSAPLSISAAAMYFLKIQFLKCPHRQAAAEEPVSLSSDSSDDSVLQ